MRDLTRVIEFICQEVIPVEETAIVQALRDIATKAVYTPPESQARLWRLMSHALREYLGWPTDVAWKIRIDNICADKEKIPEEWKA